jgi:Excalibur calcium-binding domain
MARHATQRSERPTMSTSPIAGAAALLAGLLLLVGVVGCGRAGGDSELDSAAEKACAGAQALRTDGDLLTDDEIRDEVKDMYADAESSSAPGVADATRDMLAAVTAGEDGHFLAALHALEQACGVTRRAEGVSFSSCSEAERLGAAPIAKEHPDYRGYLDRDNNGVACDEG